MEGVVRMVVDNVVGEVALNNVVGKVVVIASCNAACGIS